MSHDGQAKKFRLDRCHIMGNLVFCIFHGFVYATSLVANVLSLVSAWVKSDHDATFAGRVVSRGKMLS